MTDFAELGILLNPVPAEASAGFNKIPKLVKGGILMIIHIYAKVSTYNILFSTGKARRISLRALPVEKIVRREKVFPTSLARRENRP